MNEGIWLYLDPKFSIFKVISITLKSNVVLQWSVAGNQNSQLWDVAAWEFRLEPNCAERAMVYPTSRGDLI